MSFSSTEACVTINRRVNQMRPTTPQNRTSVHKSIVTACLALLAFGATARGQQQTTLRRIEVLGLQRMSSDQVVQLSGLQLLGPDWSEGTLFRLAHGYQQAHPVNVLPKIHA